MDSPIVQVVDALLAEADATDKAVCFTERQVPALRARQRELLSALRATRRLFTLSESVGGELVLIVGHQTRYHDGTAFSGRAWRYRQPVQPLAARGGHLAAVTSCYRVPWTRSTRRTRAMNAAALAVLLGEQAKQERAKKGGKAGGVGRPKNSLSATSAPKLKDRGHKSTVKAAKSARVSERKVRNAASVRKAASCPVVERNGGFRSRYRPGTPRATAALDTADDPGKNSRRYETKTPKPNPPTGARARAKRTRPRGRG